MLKLMYFALFISLTTLLGLLRHGDESIPNRPSGRNTGRRPSTG